MGPLSQYTGALLHTTIHQSTLYRKAAGQLDRDPDKPAARGLATRHTLTWQCRVTKCMVFIGLVVPLRPLLGVLMVAISITPHYQLGALSVVSQACRLQNAVVW